MNRARRQRFSATFAALAFAAAFLLALAPALSRVLRVAAATNAADAIALCTHAGLQQLALPAQHDAATQAHDGDCAYCPLLAHGTLPAQAANVVIAALPPQVPASPRDPIIARAQHRLAAQPRGPPLPVAA